MEEGIVIGKVFDQDATDGVEIFFKDRRQILTREVVEELDGEVESGEVGLDEFFVALI